MQDKLRWPYRAVSKEWQAMSWKWLEPDTGAFRVKRLCRLGRLLLTRWRSLCQPGLARPHHPGDGDQWHEDATGSETLSTNSEKRIRWTNNQRVLRECESARHYGARRSSIYTRGSSCVNGPLVKKPWLVRPRQPCVLELVFGGGIGPNTTGHREWMVPVQGRQCLPSAGALLPPWSFDSPACSAEDTGG